MSDSSSEDEQLKQLKEAVDSQFIDDSMYNSSLKVESTPLKTEIKSLRKNISDEDEQYNIFKTTPEFRKYVAKHLERIIEESLQGKLKTTSSDVVKRRSKSRVRLLSSSRVFLKGCGVDDDKKFVDNHNKISKRQIKIDVNEETEKIRAVAVDSDFILSQVELKYWRKRNRELFKVKHYTKNPNGELILVNPVSKF